MSVIERGLLTESDLPGPSWFHPTLSQLAKFLSLGDDWDGYGAKATHESAVKRAVAVLNAVCPAGPEPWVVPTSDGGMQIEWASNGLEIEIEVLPAGPAQILIVEPSGQESSSRQAKNLRCPRSPAAPRYGHSCTTGSRQWGGHRRIQGCRGTGTQPADCRRSPSGEPRTRPRDRQQVEEREEELARRRRLHAAGADPLVRVGGSRVGVPVVGGAAGGRGRWWAGPGWAGPLVGRAGAASGILRSLQEI